MQGSALLKQVHREFVHEDRVLGTMQQMYTGLVRWHIPDDVFSAVMSAVMCVVQ